MSKYDFKVDLTSNTSTGLLLQKVGEAMTVLEFGCATGRMTRYMKEALHCKVYIVEYEKSAFDVAIQYAEDGVCGDILQLEWCEKFKDVRFDVILFADVLEHLVNPSLAMRNAAKFLKKDGRILLSIPNVTHNDILLKAISDRFDYTKVGILDDTHVHFWGLQNIVEFAGDCGLRVDSVEATYCPMGRTEQFESESLEAYPPMLLNVLNERPTGSVYQFVLALSKGKQDWDWNRIVKFLKPGITGNLYLDTGDGYNAQQVVPVQAERVSTDEYVFHHVLEPVPGLRQVRFDPVEHQDCIIKYINTRQGDRTLTVAYPEHIQLENGKLVTGTDPMVFIDIPASGEPVIIDANILLEGPRYIDALSAACIDARREQLTGREKIEALRQEHERAMALEAEKYTKKEAEYLQKIDALNQQHTKKEAEYLQKIDVLNQQHTKKEAESFEQIDVMESEWAKREAEWKDREEAYQKKLEKLSKSGEETAKHQAEKYDRLAEQYSVLEQKLKAYANLLICKDEELIRKDAALDNTLAVSKSYNRRVEQLMLRLTEKDKALQYACKELNTMQSMIQELEQDRNA